jgi:hypothetical protein
MLAGDGPIGTSSILDSFLDAVDRQLLHLAQNGLDLCIQLSIGIVIPDVVRKVPSIRVSQVNDSRIWETDLWTPLSLAYPSSANLN